MIDKFDVSISEICLKKIYRYIQNTPVTKESGGVILGELIEHIFFIEDITTPQKKDKSTRTNFFRSLEHNQAAQNIVAQSNLGLTYIGLWHTHPEDFPRYSYIDKLDWINALSQSKFKTEGLIFIIAGIKRICVWYGDEKTKSIKFIKEIYINDE
ncbi:Mov34/MPN/PAD-1 family protein [Cysteiniphilum litorale]|uniref:Mov34/MPN/PAD-1 family protein n=1 Tax=Cysteiniphilum litorale TaxID=2056700 RepID=UPI003F88290C